MKQRTLKLLRPEDVAEAFSAQEIFGVFSAEERRRGIPPEEVFRAFPPEEIRAYLKKLPKNKAPEKSKKEMPPL